MPVSLTIVDLEPLLLSPAEAAPYPSASKRSLSGLISEGKIEARKHGPRTLVDVASLKTYSAGLPIVFGRRAHALPSTLAQSRH